MSEKTAIVATGGGMKSAYSAGALVALGEKLGVTAPDIAIAASGSAGSLLYYLAGQYPEIRLVWTDFLASRKFIQYSPFPRLRIDYLIDTLFKEHLPIQVERIQKIETKYFIPVTDVHSGEVTFISNDSWFDLYEIMRAATSNPYLYKGHIQLGGESYIDGELLPSTTTLIRKALDAGARKILFISNDELTAHESTYANQALSFALPSPVRDMVLLGLKKDEIVEWPENIDIVCISPSRSLSTLPFTRDRAKISEAFELGFNDVLNKHEDIARLFQRN